MINDQEFYRQWRAELQNPTTLSNKDLRALEEVFELEQDSFDSTVDFIVYETLMFSKSGLTQDEIISESLTKLKHHDNIKSEIINSIEHLLEKQLINAMKTQATGFRTFIYYQVGPSISCPYCQSYDTGYYTKWNPFYYCKNCPGVFKNPDLSKLISKTENLLEPKTVCYLNPTTKRKLKRNYEKAKRERVDWEYFALLVKRAAREIQATKLRIQQKEQRREQDRKLLAKAKSHSQLKLELRQVKRHLEQSHAKMKAQFFDKHNNMAKARLKNKISRLCMKKALLEDAIREEEN